MSKAGNALTRAAINRSLYWFYAPELTLEGLGFDHLDRISMPSARMSQSHDRISEPTGRISEPSGLESVQPGRGGSAGRTSLRGTWMSKAGSALTRAAINRSLAYV